MQRMSCSMHQHHLHIVFTITLLTAAALMIHRTAQAYEVDDCVRCHDSAGTESRLHISVNDFNSSAHGKETTCLGCHLNVVDDSHAQAPGSGSVECGQCHNPLNRHGMGAEDGNRPRCFHCHTKHTILGKSDPRSSIHSRNLKESCRSCHPAPCGQTSFFSWLPSLKVASHPKQDFSQSYSAYNCIGCHQGRAAHGEEDPLSDELCSVCHTPIAAKAALAGYVHAASPAGKRPVSFAAGLISMAALAFLAWGGLRYYIIRFSGNGDTEEV